MCGIYAIISKTDKSLDPLEIINGLQNLQHRGKDGFGIVYTNYYNNTSHVIKKSGMINESATILDELNSKAKNTNIYIGHNRYSTSGGYLGKSQISLTEQQPLRFELNQISDTVPSLSDTNHPATPLWLVHNGNIPLIKGHDTLHIINHIINNTYDNIEDALISLINNIPAAYSLIILHKDTIYIIRDRFGIRPLCVYESNDNFYVSSESCSLPLLTSNNQSVLGPEQWRDVIPGEIIRIKKNTLESIYLHPQSQLSLCTFEILYFSHENSILDKYNVKKIRQNLATKLALLEDYSIVSNSDVVIGIPDTGITLGKAYAKHLGLEYQQLITKNPRASRTFIVKSVKDRKNACINKFIYQEDKLYGKNVIIVDDTIVRGTVISAIIERLKNIGVKQIHIRIPAPPVIDVCHLGISIQNKEELIITGHTIEEVREKIKATSLRYLQVKDISEILPEKSYNHCFTSYIDPIILPK